MWSTLQSLFPDLSDSHWRLILSPEDKADQICVEIGIWSHYMWPLASLKANAQKSSLRTTAATSLHRCMLRRDHNIYIYFAFHRFLSEEAQLVLSVLSWHKIAKWWISLLFFLCNAFGIWQVFCSQTSGFVCVWRYGSWSQRSQLLPSKERESAASHQRIWEETGLQVTLHDVALHFESVGVSCCSRILLS